MLRHSRPVFRLAFSDDGRRAVTACDDDFVRLWDLSESKVLVERKMGAFDLSFAGDERVVVLTRSWGSGTLFAWDLVSDSKMAEIFVDTALITTVSISSDCETALIGSNDRTVRVVNLQTGACLRVLEGHTRVVWSGALSRDGRFALTGDSVGVSRVWDLESGICVREAKHHRGAVTAAAISPDGKRAMTASFRDEIVVWDLKTGERRQTLFVAERHVYDARFTQDGRSALALCGDVSVFLFDVRSGNLMKSWDHEGRPVCDIAVSKDGNSVLIGTVRAGAILWECTQPWKLEMWSVLSSKKWDAEMARELSHFF